MQIKTHTRNIIKQHCSVITTSSRCLFVCAKWNFVFRFLVSTFMPAGTYRSSHSLLLDKCFTPILLRKCCLLVGKNKLLNVYCYRNWIREDVIDIFRIYSLILAKLMVFTISIKMIVMWKIICQWTDPRQNLIDGLVISRNVSISLDKPNNVKWSAFSENNLCVYHSVLSQR